MLRSNARGTKVVRAGGLRSQWQALFKHVTPLPEDVEVLRRIIAASEVQAEKFADMRLVELKEVLQEMASADASQGAAISIAHRLQGDHCIAEPLLTNAWCKVRPSYVGAVIATQREISEHETLVRQLAEEWETTSVEFKELLQLDADRQKAEFCKDVLALANTIVSSRRFLVIGFSNRTRLFTTVVDPKVDLHRIESILSEYCTPVPEIKYTVIELPEGKAGLVEVVSDRARLPYRLARDIANLKAGTVFVRHNTLTAVCEGEELEYLEEEGRRVRGEIT